MWGIRVSQVALGLWLAGCGLDGAIYDNYTPSPAVVPAGASGVDSSSPPGPIDLDSYCFAEDVDSAASPVCAETAYVKAIKAGTAERACLPGAWPAGGKPSYCPSLAPYLEGRESADSPPTQAMALRDRLQDVLLDRSNTLCDEHLSLIIGTASYANAGASILSTSLAALSAAFGGTAAKTALATAAAIVSGSQAAINGEVLLGYVAPAIVKQIVADRDRLLEQFAASRKQPIWDYSVESALVDVGRYHYACSFFAGLSALVNDDSAKRGELTDDQIKAKIADLEAENVALRALLANNAGDRSLQAQLTLNEARLLQLRALRVR